MWSERILHVSAWVAHEAQKSTLDFDIPFQLWDWAWALQALGVSYCDQTRSRASEASPTPCSNYNIMINEQIAESPQEF